MRRCERSNAMGVIRRWVLAGLAVALVSGCASFSDGFAKVEQAAAQRNLAAAQKSLDDLRLAGADQALHHLNKGVLLRWQGQFDASNRELDAAKRLMEESGAISVSEQALSVVANDTVKAYEGDGVEQLMIYAMKSLNYLQSGELDAAAVEARQFDIKYRLIREAKPDATYLHAPFVHYLNGMIFEAVGERDSARIEYAKAIEGYEAQARLTGVSLPEGLRDDLARVSDADVVTRVVEPKPQVRAASAEPEPVKRNERRSRQKKARAAVVPDPEPPVVSAPAPPKAEPVKDGTGELVFFLHNGLGPSLAEQIIQVPNPQPNTGAAWLRLALPKYVERTPPVARVELSAGGQRVSGQLAENMVALGKASLDDRLPAIQARAVARLVAKNVAAAAAKKKADEKGGGGGALAKLITDIAVIASERADTRTWALLPGSIHLARLRLSEGTHTLDVSYFGPMGAPLGTRRLADVRVREGQRTFVADYYLQAAKP